MKCLPIRPLPRSKQVLRRPSELARLIRTWPEGVQTNSFSPVMAPKRERPNPTRAPLSGGVVVLQGRYETLWELAGLATTGTHGGYNDSPE
jgi:hypothetical protein